MTQRFGSKSILVTQQNLNNHLGVPLTVARLRSNHLYALFELGASAIGEIDHLAAIVRPKVSALLNARAATLKVSARLEASFREKVKLLTIHR